MTLVPTQRRRIERKVLPRGDEAPGRNRLPPGGFPRRGYRTPGRSRRVDGAPGSGRGVPYFQGPAAGRGGLTSRAATRRSVRSPPPNSTPRPLTTVSAPLRSCRNPGSGVSTRPPATGTHPCPSPEPVYRRRTPAPPRSITLLQKAPGRRGARPGPDRRVYTRARAGVYTCSGLPDLDRARRPFGPLFHPTPTLRGVEIVR